MPRERYPVTPDGRYFVVRGRLWRRSDPTLTASVRASLVGELMAARRGLRAASPAETRKAARRAIDDTKTALGERGPVWWTDGSPDFNRKMAKNTPYAAWYEALSQEEDAGVPGDSSTAG